MCVTHRLSRGSEQSQLESMSCSHHVGKPVLPSMGLEPWSVPLQAAFVLISPVLLQCEAVTYMTAVPRSGSTTRKSLAQNSRTRGLRVSRLIRLSRLVRLVRLYKASAARHEGNPRADVFVAFRIQFSMLRQIPMPSFRLRSSHWSTTCVLH